MICPDWRALVAARDAHPAAESPLWAEARRHAGRCSRCREAALAADPLLVFARLPERQVSAGEIGDMQAAVAALVRAGRVGQGSDPGLPGRRSSRRAGVAGAAGVIGLLPVARLSVFRIAAALGICSLLALSGTPRFHPAALGPLAAATRAEPEALASEALPVGSVVEELDRPGARIYELPQSDMAVVMIVDASLDV